MIIQNNRLGILLMVLTVFIFAVQDGFARYLGGIYSVLMLIMIRYWVFAAFVMVQAGLTGDFRAAVRTRHPWMHLTRTVLLITEICVMVLAYTRIGLINTHAVFAVCPLLIAGLAVPILGEKVGWRRWVAIFIGMIGVAIILQPDGGVFALDSLLPLISALLFALYSLLTRLATRDEPVFVSFFWSGVLGCVLMTVVGLPFLVSMPLFDVAMLMIYSFLALFGHYLLIRSYSMAEASALQPFAYLQIVFVTAIAMLVFDEALHRNVIIGGAIVILAGLFTVIRGRQKNQGKAMRVAQR
ncbi:EamA-like transporter family protein [Pseudorhodobacter antarcticus]|jgi:drug/metabolite transporter (DMT)-like permease|uniref:EamA-like transporter family protein n=1 Tax=Pseudorhodobacter antarcticus TaxID=1077947 RepID=A0A1H8ABK1_9RHOB|nr:DMT family transporter [Pseudorhodobacter antarcticus]SEM67179.1 EamA-like transporter family protein [Pseudorhodobacter antarcticus]